MNDDMRSNIIFSISFVVAHITREFCFRRMLHFDVIVELVCSSENFATFRTNSNVDWIWIWWQVLCFVVSHQIPLKMSSVIATVTFVVLCLIMNSSYVTFHHRLSIKIFMAFRTRMTENVDYSLLTQSIKFNFLFITFFL